MPKIGPKGIVTQIMLNEEHESVIVDMVNKGMFGVSENEESWGVEPEILDIAGCIAYSRGARFYKTPGGFVVPNKDVSVALNVLNEIVQTIEESYKTFPIDQLFSLISDRSKEVEKEVLDYVKRSNRKIQPVIGTSLRSPQGPEEGRGETLLATPNVGSSKAY